jgi:hypothetical protein
VIALVIDLTATLGLLALGLGLFVLGKPPLSLKCPAYEQNADVPMTLKGCYVITQEHGG